MVVVGVHHVSFTVSDPERTALLGTALLGAPAVEQCEADEDRPDRAQILIADMELGGTGVEFIRYVDPAIRPSSGDPSVDGSACLALLTDDTEGELRRLQAAGVRLHTPVRTVRDPGRPVWRLRYSPDPDGICVELVEGGGPEDGQAP